MHLNSITKEGLEYVYMYHVTQNRTTRRSCLIFLIAGVIGSFKVVDEKGWIWLIPFWIVILLLSRSADWIMKKVSEEGSAVIVRFTSEYPHYTAADIIWVLTNSHQTTKFGQLNSSAGNEWSKEMYISIGRLSVKKINRGNLSQNILDAAVDQQMKLEAEWSDETGQEYPDLNLPPR